MEEPPKLALCDFHSLGIYIHHKNISESALEAFDDFITGGGGVLAIHSATASFKDTDRFTNVLRWIFTGYGLIEAFDERPVSSETRIFGDIPAFQVTDELYLLISGLS